jgi:hypothetical protein
MVTIESSKISLSSPKKLFVFALIIHSFLSIILFYCLFYFKPLVPTKYPAKLRKISKQEYTAFQYYELIILNDAPSLKINSEHNFLYTDSNATQFDQKIIISEVIPYSDNKFGRYYALSKNNKMNAKISSDYFLGHIVILSSSDVTLFKNLIYK